MRSLRVIDAELERLRSSWRAAIRWDDAELAQDLVLELDRLEVEQLAALEREYRRAVRLEQFEAAVRGPRAESN